MCGSFHKKVVTAIRSLLLQMKGVTLTSIVKATTVITIIIFLICKVMVVICFSAHLMHYIPKDFK